MAEHSGCTGSAFIPESPTLIQHILHKMVELVSYWELSISSFIPYDISYLSSFPSKFTPELKNLYL